MRNLFLAIGQALALCCALFAAPNARADISVQEYYYQSPPSPTLDSSGAYNYCYQMAAQDAAAYQQNLKNGYDNHWFFDSCYPTYDTRNGKNVIAGKSESDSSYWGHVFSYGYTPYGGFYIFRPHKKDINPHNGKGCNCSTGEVSTGEPIEVGSGNMFVHESDFVSADPRLQFSRSYNSYVTNLPGQGLGSVWQHSYNAHVIDLRLAPPKPRFGVNVVKGESSMYGSPNDACVQGWAEISQGDPEYAGTTASYAVIGGLGMCKVTDASNNVIATFPVQSEFALQGNPQNSVPIGITVQRDDGAAYYFSCIQGACTTDTNVPLQLSMDASGNFTLIDQDGTTDRYDPTGLLLTRTWKDGYQLSFVHNTNGTLQSVTDLHGRAIVLTYGPPGTYGTPGLLTSASLPDGSTVNYAYDSSNRLISVKNATGTKTYQYTNTSFPNALTIETDENNNAATTWTYDANGRATSSASAGGVNSVAVAYNSNGSAVVTDPLGTQRTYSYQNFSGVPSLTAISGPFCADCGAGAASTYDSNGYLATSTDWNGNTTAFTFASNGLLSQKIDAQGSAVQRTTNLTWDTTLRNPLEQTVKDSGGNLQAKVDWMYNSSGEPLARCEADPTVTGATSYACSNTGAVPAGVRRWTYTYCAAVDTTQCPQVGLMLSASDPLGHTTNYAYYLTDDSTCATAPTTCPHRKGDLLSVTNALSQTATFTKYDGAGRLLSLTDANGVITNLAYTPRGWLSSTSTLAGATPGAGDQTTSYSYDNVGQVTRLTQPNGAYIGFTWDAAHRLTDLTDNVGNTTHYTLDNAGNRTQDATKDPSGALKRSVLRAFNAIGELYTTANANAAVNMTYGYDTNGNPNVLTDGRGTATNNSFDALNRLTQTLRDPSLVQAYTNYSYDTLDRITQVKDPHGLNTSYQYDGLGNLTQLTSPDTGVTSYTYDIAGNRLSKTDARGSTTTATYAYDALNRLTTITYPGTNQPNSAFTYDTTQTACGSVNVFGKGRLTMLTRGSSGAGTLVTSTFCYDRFGRVAQKFQNIAITGTTVSTSYAYDLANRVTQVTTPLNTIIKYTRDAAGRITAVKYRLSGQTTDTTVVSNVSYYPYGPVASITYGNGRVQTRNFDQDYVVSGISDPATGGLSLSFGRDVLGNITQVQSGSTGNNLGYDSLNRLKSVNDLNNALVAAYSYDGTGNRLSKQTPSGTLQYTYPLTSHQLINDGSASRSYDAAGNTTAIGTMKFGYDVTGRMCGSGTTIGAGCASSGSTIYVYDGQGQRVGKAALGNVQATQVITVYDEAGHPLVDYKTATTTGRIREYLWMDDLPVGVLNGSTGALGYIESDQLGTPRTVIDAANNTAVWQWSAINNPFGETQPVVTADANFASTFDLALRFPGQRYDAESGLNYNYFRDYDPSVGRYVESDPVGLSGGVSTYAYVHGRPLGSVDSTGRFDWEGLGGVAREAGVGAAFNTGFADEDKGAIGIASGINSAIGSAAASKLGESFGEHISHGSEFSASVWGSGVGELASTELDALSNGELAPSLGDLGLALTHAAVDVAVNATLDGIPGGALVASVASNAINRDIDAVVHFDLGLPSNFCNSERAQMDQLGLTATPGGPEGVPGSISPLRSLFGGNWWP